MREILFRGKRKDNGEWVEGSYLPPVGGYPPNVSTAHSIRVAGRSGLFKWHEIIPETLGQYTGLKDNNDVKIFEGDIVCINRNAPSEKYNRGFIELDYGAYVVTRSGDLSSEYLYDFSDKLDYADVEIIGNIHDNPELLDRNA
jgi:uncharacterized phage protein (TIGR01671 family)